YECEGSFVNRAGRLQAFAPARVPGLPVRRLLEGSSFPRAYHTAPPSGDVRMAWQALEMLREAAIGKPQRRGLADLRAAIARANPPWAPLREVAPGTEGIPLDASAIAKVDAPLAAFA